MKKKVIFCTVLSFLVLSPTAYAASDAAGWKFVDILRQGLLWIGIFTSFYGLYLQLLKRDDTGKKIIITSILVYAASFIIPEVFILIRDTFSK